MFMRNIDEKTFSALLERIEALKNEFSLLEEEVRALPVLPASEPVGEPVEEPDESADLPEEATVDAGQPLEPGRVHSRVAPQQVQDGAAAECGLSSAAAPAAQEPEVVVPETVEPEPVAVEPEPEVVEPEPVEIEPEPAVVEPVPEPVPEPVAEEEPIDIAPDDDTPIDINITGIEDLPDISVRSESEAALTATEQRKAILDTAKADTAVMDVMAAKQAWRTDRPGMPVKNIISAISLNDRVLLINVLFGEDPMLFQDTIAKFNAMGSLSEALAFITENHPEWDMNSEPVYRLMMAVRRKLS